ncbi:uncharacterized protein LOC100186762 [Ciona intestinalis]
MSRFVKHAKVENQRLRRCFELDGSMTSEYRLNVREKNRDCDVIRRELAQSSLLRHQRLSRDTDPTLILMKERSEERRRKNEKLLALAKRKEEGMGARVKDFVERFEKVGQDNTEVENWVIHDDVTTDDVSTSNDDVTRPVSRAWQEARNTRYVRTKMLREFEVELGPTEVFSND